MTSLYTNHSKPCDSLFTSKSDEATTFLAGAGHDNHKMEQKRIMILVL